MKDAFLAEVKSQKSTFYNLVVASAYSIEATPDKIVFAFQANKKNAKLQCEDQKAWLATIAEKVAGRPLPVTIRHRRSGCAAGAGAKHARLTRRAAQGGR